MRPLLLLTTLLACCGETGSGAARSERQAAAPSGARNDSVAALEDVSEASSTEATRRALAEALDREFPLHGLVKRPQIVIRREPNPEAEAIGWLRWGERVRLAPEVERTRTCSSGWYRVAPHGWVCSGQGVQVAPEPPPPEDPPVPPARRQQTLPYDYYYVKEPMTPEYHQLPSRAQQRAAAEFAQRYLELLERDERRAARMLAGELPGEPTVPAGVARFLHRGFFIAGTDVQERSQRRFVRTTSGGYVKLAQLEARQGSDFHGVELGGDVQLPVAWTLRDSHPRLHRVRDGEHRFVRDMELEIIPRQTLVTDLWRGRERVGDEFYHRLQSDAWEGDRWLRDWFVGVAEKIDPPFAVQDAEPWVHVDLSSQTLVVYRGREPVYATLVSSGLEGHDTPTGVFTIHRKMVTDTMANLGPDAGEDSYRIQDVPWTQYFEGSFALHAAFWHHRFGLRRSHGCVNLAPADAHRVFRETWPRVPEGWHGVSTRDTPFRASRVVVTE